MDFKKMTNEGLSKYFDNATQFIPKKTVENYPERDEMHTNCIKVLVEMRHRAMIDEKKYLLRMALIDRIFW